MCILRRQVTSASIPFVNIILLSLNTSRTLNDDNWVEISNFGHLFSISGSCPPHSGLNSSLPMNIPN